MSFHLLVVTESSIKVWIRFTRNYFVNFNAIKKMWVCVRSLSGGSWGGGSPLFVKRDGKEIIEDHDIRRYLLVQLLDWEEWLHLSKYIFNPTEWKSFQIKQMLEVLARVWSSSNIPRIGSSQFCTSLREEHEDESNRQVMKGEYRSRWIANKHRLDSRVVSMGASTETL